MFSSNPGLVSLRYLARAVLAAAGLNPLYVSLRLTREGAHNAGSLLLTGQHFIQIEDRLVAQAWGGGRAPRSYTESTIRSRPKCLGPATL